MRLHKAFTMLTAGVLAASLLAGCGGGKAGDQPKQETKKEKTKLILGFVPSQNAAKLADTAKPLADMLQKELGDNYEVTPFVSADFGALGEAMGSGKVDIGFLNPFTYVLAHDKYGVEVVFKVVRQGSDHYRAQFMTRPDTGIKKIEDLKGKKFGFVDVNSTSGYLFPAVAMKDKGIDPETGVQATFLKAHDNVVKAILNGDVDAGVAYEDARDRLVQENPDVKQKVIQFAFTDNIPNDTVSLRKDLPADLKAQITAALKKIAATDEGKKVLHDIYEIDGLAEAKDADYDIVRKVNQYGLKK